MIFGSSPSSRPFSVFGELLPIRGASASSSGGNTLRVRSAALADLDAIIGLHIAARNAQHRGFVPEHELAEIAASPGGRRHRPNAPHLDHPARLTVRLGIAACGYPALAVRLG